MGSIEQYAEDPDLFAQHSEDGGLMARLGRRLFGNGQADGQALRDAWSIAVKLLAQPGRIREFYDLIIVVAPALVGELAPEAARCVLFSLHSKLTGQPFLVFCHEGEALPDYHSGNPCPGITGVEYYYGGDGQHCARALPNSGGHGGWQASSDDGLPELPHRLFLALEDAPEDNKRKRSEVINASISQLLTRVLVYGRPLRYYRCTFFLPLDLRHNNQDAFHDALVRRAARASKVKHYRYRTHAKDEENHRNPSPKSSENDADPRDSPAAREAQAYWYFSPTIRDLLYELEPASDVALEPLQEWRLIEPEADQDRWQLELGNYEDRRTHDPLKHVIAEVKSVTLYRYFNGIYLLGVSVKPASLPSLGAERCTLFSDADHWWQALVFSGEHELRRLQSLQVAAWLRFTKLARVLYPSYPEQAAEDKIASLRLWEDPTSGPVTVFNIENATAPLKIPKAAGQELSPIILHILKQLFGECVGGRALGDYFEGFREVHDDRMFINATYGLSGSTPADEHEREQFRKIYTLALFVDGPSDTFSTFDGYAYDPDFLKNEHLNRNTFRMWERQGLLYGFTAMSNVSVGSGGFFNNVIAPSHVPYIYERMLILALFYQASLRRYERQVTEATKELVDKRASQFRELRRQFIRFTNQYWFHRLTPQMQGKEMFALQQEALGLQQEYEFIKDEMERADEFSDAQRNLNIAVCATIVAALAGWFTFLPVLDSTSGVSTYLNWMFFWPNTPALSGFELILLSIIPPAALGLLAWIGLKWIPRLWILIRSSWARAGKQHR